MLSKIRASRKGLTLMEMVVVLTILAALASILIPLFPNLLRRTHKAVDATQTSELSKAIQLYQALYIAYPDDWDLLTDGAAFPNFMPGTGSSAGVFGGFVTPTALTQPEIDALGRVGITNVQPMGASLTAVDHPSLSPYTSGTTVVTNRKPLDTSLKCAVIDGANSPIWKAVGGVGPYNLSFLQADHAADPTARYVVFGVGPRSAMVGRVMQDAPLSAPQEKGFTPGNTYCRVGVVFKVSGSEVSITERARMIACVALEDDELEQTDKDITGYYDVVKSGQ